MQTASAGKSVPVWAVLPIFECRVRVCEPPTLNFCMCGGADLPEAWAELEPAGLPALLCVVFGGAAEALSSTSSCDLSG